MRKLLLNSANVLSASTAAVAPQATAQPTTGQPTAAQPTTGSPRIALAEGPDLLDPTLGSNFIEPIGCAALCDRLSDLAPNLNVVRQFAIGYRYKSRTSLVTTSRPGVVFHDDEKFDAGTSKFRGTSGLSLKGSKRAGGTSAIQTIGKIGPSDPPTGEVNSANSPFYMSAMQPPARDIASAKAPLTRVGFDVTVKVTDLAASLPTGYSGDVHAYMIGWSGHPTPGAARGA